MIPEKITEILDRYFKSFIDQTRDWDFFLGLADYVKYINTTSPIRRITDYLVKEGAKNEREEDYNNKIEVGLWRAWDYLTQVYITISKTKEEIKKEIKDWQTVLALKEEMGKIKLPSAYSIKSFMPVHFVKDAYISYATRIHNYLIQELSKTEVEKQIPQLKNSLKSIHLISHSLEPQTVIFLVLDERFEIPIRCAVKNKRGEETYIKKLYNVAYIVNVPGKRVDYNRNLANDINNGLFRRRQIVKYMKTNKLKKPTLIQKSEDGDYLVLKNEIPVKTGLVNHNVPVQYQSLYIDKTK